MTKVFILGSKCNMDCKFCLSREKDLSPERIIRELLSARGTVVFTGGEPLAYSYLGEVLKFAKSLGLKTKVHTNGILLKSVDYTDYIDVINLPLDGPKKIHDSMRYDGHFDIVMHIFDEFKDKEFSITTVLTKKNIEYIDELFDIVDSLAAKVKISSWKIFKFKPVGRGMKYREEFEISDEEFEEAITHYRFIGTKVFFIKDPDKMGVEVVREL